MIEVSEIKARVRLWIPVAKRTLPYAEELLSNEVYVLVSAIAMNALLSFFPFVILLVSVATRYFSNWEVDEMTYAILARYLPSELGSVIRTLKGLSRGFGTIQLISLFVLIWSVANVFIPLEMALNRAWGVKESRGFWRSQWLAVVMSSVSGILAFLFVAGAALTWKPFDAFLSADWIRTRAVIEFVIIKLWMLPLTLIMFSVVFYLVPNKKVAWRDVLPTAIFTGLLWEVSNYIYMWVTPWLGFGEIYGTLAVAVIWMTWAYVSGLILILGANLTARQVFAEYLAKKRDVQSEVKSTLVAIETSVSKSPQNATDVSGLE